MGHESPDAAGGFRKCRAELQTEIRRIRCSSTAKGLASNRRRLSRSTTLRPKEVIASFPTRSTGLREPAPWLASRQSRFRKDAGQFGRLPQRRSEQRAGSVSRVYARAVPSSRQSSPIAGAVKSKPEHRQADREAETNSSDPGFATCFEYYGGLATPKVVGT